MEHDHGTSRSASAEELKDPMSGYASGDALDSGPQPNQPPAGNAGLRDPMSGYASGDVLDPRHSVNRPEEAGAGAQLKDPMSGYASADALEEDDQSSA